MTRRIAWLVAATTSAVVVAFIVPLGILVALSMPRKGIGVSVCLVLMALPLLIPWNVVGTIWQVFGRVDIGVIAETILLGWEDISFKGEVLEYNVANAKKLLAVKDFRKTVAQFADDVSAFKFKETEEQGKA